MFGTSNLSNQIDHEVFINAIRERPALWQVKHPEHRNQRVKRALWNEIQQSFPIIVDVEDLKKKWKNLKDAYRKELKKISVLQSSDPLASNIQSQWIHYQYMDFLREEIMAKEDWEVYVPTNAQSLVTVKQEPQDHIITGQDYKEFQPVESEQPSQRITSSPKANSPARRSSTSSEHSETANTTKKRPNANDLRTEYLEIEKKKLKILEKELSLQNIEARELTKSDDYHFLMSILPEMSKLPPLQKMRVRNKINEIMMEQMQEVSNGNCYTDMKMFNVT